MAAIVDSRIVPSAAGGSATSCSFHFFGTNGRLARFCDGEFMEFDARLKQRSKGNINREPVLHVAYSQCCR
ncbi:UNVERIFIED_CONTAM: hypothetical protein Slati_2778700 [Sesamum latifolium]|uniref:Uncharacterized protein n=1 Tax=Sesamum latifolium TaxID=2727402 RepID=A0AAW2VZR9_9LAMI